MTVAEYTNGHVGLSAAFSPQDHSRDLEFWRTQLAGDLPACGLPYDYPYPSVGTRSYAAEQFTMPNRLAEDLTSLAVPGDNPQFLSCLTGFIALLSRYTGQDKIVVGTLGDNRSVPDENAAETAGHPLALRVDVSGNPTFRELQSRVNSVLREALEHQGVAFPRVLAELSQRSGQHTLFTVAVSHHLGTSRNAFRRDDFSEGGQMLDLDITIEEHDGQISGTITYPTNLFTPETITSMVAYWQNLLAAACSDPDRRISELPMLTEGERNTILFEWNDTRVEYPNVCVQELFEQQAAKTPDATAVVFEGQRLSYRELNERANQLGRYLRKRGVGPDILVGVSLERIPEMVVGLLGIWKAGGAYVPLDPSYPKERLSFMMEDSAAKLLLTNSKHRSLFGAIAQKLILLDSDWSLVSEEASGNFNSGACSSNLAYVMYTSGSTGEPKGAMILHSGLANYLCWAIRAYAVQEGGSVPVHSSISFDLTVTSMYTPLLAGGCIELLPEDVGAQNLLAALRRSGNRNLVKITPAHLELLSLELKTNEAAAVTKVFVIGGENLSAESLRLWRDFAPGTRLINEYGPTETVVGCCVHEVAASEPRSGSVPIGRPIANTQLYVLDPQMNPVPPGVMGELYIGGAGVARGYWNRPELTKQRFLPDPFCGRCGACLYKTGDLARYRKDGVLEFLGRIDSQVKVRGYRIELGEIEVALSSHAAVKQCVVVARGDAPGDKQLVAYFELQGKSLPSADDFRMHLKQTLPDYMLPSALVPLEKLPLTPNGKIDRKALPAPNERNTGDHVGLLLDIWKRVLGVRSCGMTDTFFELGGDSLLLVRLVTMIEKEFKKVVPLPFLFEFATIEKVAAFLRDGSATKPNFFVPFKDSGVGPAFFCVHSVVGDVMSYRHFTRFLDSEQRFYGIQLPPELRTSEFVSSVEAIASRYVDELLAFEPQGPYILGGWSAGASLALEMAQQLHARGHVVDLLVAIDAAPWNTMSGTSRWNPRYYWKLLRNFPHWVIDDFAANFSWRGFFSRASRRLSAPVRRVVAAGRGRAELEKYKVNAFLGSGDYSESAKLFIGAFYQTLQRYVPKHYNGRVVFYKAKTQPLFYLMEVDRAWRKLATDPEVVLVNGTHVTLIDASRIRPLAEHLNGRLRECRNRVLSLHKDSGNGSGTTARVAQ